MRSPMLVGVVTCLIFAVPCMALADDTTVSKLQQMLDDQKKLIDQLTQQVHDLQAQLAQLLGNAQTNSQTPSGQFGFPAFAQLPTQPATALPNFFANLLGVSTSTGSGAKVSDVLLHALQKSLVAGALNMPASSTSSTTPQNETEHASDTGIQTAPQLKASCLSDNQWYAEGSAIYGSACPGAACSGVTGPLLVCTGEEWFAQGVSVCSAYPSLSSDGNSAQFNAAGKAYLRSLGCHI